MPHELPYDLRLMKLRKQENLKTSLKYSLVPSLSTKMKISSILPKTC